MTARYTVRRRTPEQADELQPAGLVLGHSVHVAAAGGQAHRGTVTALDPDVEVRLDRAKWSDGFRVGDRVRAVHASRRAVEATVVGSAHGTLRLRLENEEDQ